jgi:hypothetical protein
MEVASDGRIGPAARPRPDRTDRRRAEDSLPQLPPALATSSHATMVQPWPAPRCMFQRAERVGGLTAPSCTPCRASYVARYAQDEIGCMNEENALTRRCARRSQRAAAGAGRFGSRFSPISIGGQAARPSVEVRAQIRHRIGTSGVRMAHRRPRLNRSFALERRRQLVAANASIARDTCKRRKGSMRLIALRWT